MGDGLLRNTILPLLVVLVSLMMFQCAPVHREKAGEFVSPLPVTQSTDFGKEIARVESEAIRQGSPQSRANMHLILGLLYSHPNNPKPDYGQAIAELEQFIALSPDTGRNDVVDHMILIVQEIDRCLRAVKKENQYEDSIRTLREELNRIQKENEKNRLTIKGLTKENQEMKEAIEKLQHLDLEIEEQRKKMRQ
jgi:tetratricopeptide (TPR) repeat protein